MTGINNMFSPSGDVNTITRDDPWFMMKNNVMSKQIKQNSNIYIDFMNEENINSVDPADVCDGEISELTAMIDTAHNVIQARIQEYIYAKHSLKITERCKVDVEDRISSLQSITSQISTVCGKTIPSLDMKDFNSSVFQMLDEKITEKRVQFEKAQRKLRCAIKLAHMLANPINYEAVRYEAGYNL